MNYRDLVLATLAVFISWEVLDYIIYSMILMHLHEKTASLWRPMEELKMGLMLIVLILSALAYVLIYSLLIKDKTLKNGLLFGLLFGIGTGISMGYGTYSVQPIPNSLALGWSIGSLVESLVAGALVGWLVKS
jgi:hypothetical protein